MELFIVFLIGCFVSSICWFVYIKKIQKNQDDMKSVFNELSQQVFDSNSERFIQLAKMKLETQTKEGEKDLENKKQLIDSSLDKVEKKLAEIEKGRSQDYGNLSSQLKRATEQTEGLQKLTNDLKAVLSNNQIRGQWGERMAEDILRMAGFIEGVQYEKQKMQDDSRTKPDFTFNMPDGHVLNMDTKFPFNNYEQYLTTESELEKEKYKKEFLKDVKNRLREIKDRNYINSNTLDYVLLFIPNEQIYSFINEHDRGILDEALQSKVIVCGPNTLYAILAVIRQATDSFKLKKASAQVIDLLNGFKEEWAKYLLEFDRLEKQYDTFGKTFDKVKGVRTRQLEKQIDKVEVAYQTTELDKIEVKDN